MKKFFNFSKGEQHGIIILLLLIVVVLLMNFFISNRPLTPSKSSDIIAWERDVQDFENHKQSSAQRYDSIRAVQAAERELRFQNQYTKYSFPDDKPIKSKPEYFFFDPNTATINEFVQLGFSQKQAEAIERYRNRGAVFKEKNDFSKVFVVSEEMFTQLEPWIVIQSTTQKTQTVQEIIPTEMAFLMLELNSCDTSQLKRLKGIGDVLSKKIVTYRTKLGGYYSVDQLLEINGIDDDLLKQIAPHFTLDVTAVKKIDLNKVTFKQLLQHPYFEYHIVKNIFNYKDQKGKLVSVEQLKEVPLIYEELYNKFYPYLIIHQQKL